MHKKIHLFGYLMVLCACISAHAQNKISVETSFDGSDETLEETLYYNILSESTVAVTSPGDDASYSGVIIIPASVEYDGTTYSVTSIEEGAFASCTGLTSLTIGENITSIEAGAVSGCPDLEEIVFNAENCTSSGSSNHYPIVDCSSLATVTIGENVGKIPQYLFSGCTTMTTVNYNATACTAAAYNSSSAVTFSKDCTSLATVNIGANVTSMPDRVFSACTGITTVNFNAVACSSAGSKSYPTFSASKGLSSVNIANNVEIIPAYMFDADNASNFASLTSVTLPESVKTIGAYAFYKCSNITGLTIGANVETIGSYAFSGCAGFTTLTIGSGVKTLGYHAFENCTGISSVEVPGTVTSMYGGVFHGCSELESAALKNTLTSVPDSTFYNCTSLTSVTIESEITKIGKFAFGYCAFESYTLPSTVESIESHAFWNCSSMKEVALGNSLTTIGEEAFYNCTSLEKIEIPYSVQTIGESAFQGCTAMTEATIGTGVTSIGKDAFKYCTSLVTVYYNATNCTYAGTAGTFYYTAFHHSCLNLTNFIIGDNVQTIPSYLLYGESSETSQYPSLKEITIPESVTTINANAFYRCNALETIYYDAAAATYEGSGTDPVFKNCNNVKKIKLGLNITSIPDNMFYGFDNLEEVYVYNTTPPTTISNAFTQIPSSTWLLVPEDYGVAYDKSTSWNTYFSHQREMTVTITPSAYKTENEYYYSTRYSPYSYTLDEGLLGGIIYGIESDLVWLKIEWKFNGNDKENNVIPAGLPIIVKSATNDSHANPTLATSDIAETAENQEDETQTNWLRGNTVDGIEYYNYYATADATELTVNNFYTYVAGHSAENLSADKSEYYFYKLTFGDDGTDYANTLGFYWADAETQTYNKEKGAPFFITGKKAWLAVPKSTFDGKSPEDASCLAISSFDEQTDAEESVTGITTAKTDSGTVSSPVIYNLQGVKVSDMSKPGVYIVNGKKTVKR